MLSTQISCLLAVLSVTASSSHVPNVPNGCQNIRCPAGTVCRVDVIMCVRAPCPQPEPECRPIEKIGSCPVVPPGQIGICVARCSTDADCSGTLKCCGNCPRECTPAAPPLSTEKPGFCPIPTGYGQSSICVNECTNDFSCPRDSKCCVNGCRRTCERLLLEAPYVDSDPCRRQVCSSHQVCKLQQVICVRAPCPAQPMCVAKSLADISSVCTSGYPVLDIRQRPLSCSGSLNTCPVGTTCKEGRCCWNHLNTVTPPPLTSCPAVSYSSYGFSCYLQRRCITDINCPPDQKCCNLGRCGKRCIDV